MNSMKCLTIALVAVLASAGSVLAADPPYDPATSQVNISGATLLETFFTEAGSTNDYIDLNNDGFYRYQPLTSPFVDQSAKTWNDFQSSPPSQSSAGTANDGILVSYRGVGSGSGLAEMLTFQAVQHATNKSWFPISNYGGSANNNPYTTGGSTYGILPTGIPGGAGVTNRGLWADGGLEWTPSPGAYANASGIPLKQNSVDIGIMDVPTKWFVQNTSGTPAWNKKPTQPGYGTNPRVASDAIGRGNKIKSLDITLVNPANPTQTEVVSFNTNTDAGSADAKTVFDTPVCYVPMSPILNRGVNQRDWEMSELQCLFTTGRTETGENLVAATRDSGSGTRNGSMNSLGIDPSWGVGDNVGDKTGDKTYAKLLGPNHKTNNLGSSSIMAPVVANNRLAVGYNGVEASMGKITGGSADFEFPHVKKDIGPDGSETNGYVRPTLDNIMDNADASTGWQMGGNETMATVGNPHATTHNPTNNDYGLGPAPALTLPAGEANQPMTNPTAALYIRNIEESVDGFSTGGGTGDQFMPGELLAQSFFLIPAVEKRPGDLDGAEWQANATNAALRNFTRNNHFLGTFAGEPQEWDDNTSGQRATRGINGWVPQRQAAGQAPVGFEATPTTWDDGTTSTDGGAYGYYWNNGGTKTWATVAGKALLNDRNKVQADFNGDGLRNIDDAISMMACITSGNILDWAYAQGSAGGNAGGLADDVVLPHIIGDFDGSGNFDADDVRYFADGLAIGTSSYNSDASLIGKLDRKKGFELADSQSDGNFFDTTLANGVAYTTGASMFDVAGSVTSGNALLGATPGAGPNGADGVIDGYDVSYLTRVMAGALTGNNDPASWVDPDIDGDNAVEWNAAERVFADLSVDFDGDFDVDADDLDAILGLFGSTVADADLNGKVDSVDLATIGLNWDPVGGAGLWQDGDFNGDTKIDAEDLAAIGLNWNPSGAVPEPATMSLLALGGLALIRRKK